MDRITYEVMENVDGSNQVRALLVLPSGGTVFEDETLTTFRVRPLPFTRDILGRTVRELDAAAQADDSAYDDVADVPVPVPTPAPAATPLADLAAGAVGPKYRLEREGDLLYRLYAVRRIDTPYGVVHPGDRGGLVEHEAVLSHHGACWIHDGSQVIGGRTRVLDDVQIRVSRISGGIFRGEVAIIDCDISQGRFSGQASLTSCRINTGGIFTDQVRLVDCATVGSVSVFFSNQVCASDSVFGNPDGGGEELYLNYGNFDRAAVRTKGDMLLVDCSWGLFTAFRSEDDGMPGVGFRVGCQHRQGLPALARLVHESGSAQDRAEFEPFVQLLKLRAGSWGVDVEELTWEQ